MRTVSPNILDSLPRLSLAALAGGLCAATGYVLPLPYWLAAFLLTIGFTVFFLCVMKSASPLRALFAGWLFALGLHGLALYWMFEVVLLFGFAGRFFGALLVAAYIAGLSLSGALCAGLLALVPASLRTRILLYGGPPLALLSWWLVHRFLYDFPWFAFGEWLLDGPLAGLLSLAGAQWAGALPLAFAATAAVAIDAKSELRRCLVYLAALIALCALALFVAPGPPAPAASGLSGRVVALNFSRQNGRTPGATERLARYIQLTRPGPPVELSVWPESTADEHIAAFTSLLRRRLLPAGEREGPSYAADTADAGPHAAPTKSLWLGAREIEGDQKYNVLYDVANDAPVYRKRRLVPFTEYVPGRFFAYLFESLELTIKNNDILAAPDREQAFEWRGRAVYPLLCYEIAYPELLAGARRAGFILNAGNETWFATGAVRRGTLRQARARARESGLPVVRAITGGYSGFIDPFGETNVAYDERGGFTRLDGKVVAYPAGATPFTGLGGWLPGLLVFVFLLIAATTEALAHSIRRRSRESARP